MDTPGLPCIDDPDGYLPQNTRVIVVPQLSCSERGQEESSSCAELMARAERGHATRSCAEGTKGLTEGLCGWFMLMRALFLPALHGAIIAINRTEYT